MRGGAPDSSEDINGLVSRLHKSIDQDRRYINSIDSPETYHRFYVVFYKLFLPDSGPIEDSMCSDSGLRDHKTSLQECVYTRYSAIRMLVCLSHWT